MTSEEEGPQLKVEVIMIMKNKGLSEMTNKTSYLEFNNEILDYISSMHLQSLTDPLDT